MDDLYQQEILHHFKHPQNYGILHNADLVIEETNSSCGDSATFYIKFSSDKKSIKDIKFTSTGCAISKAASSILTEYIKGKTIKKAQNIQKNIMQELIGIEVGTAREKCLMLAATALRQLQSELKS